MMVIMVSVKPMIKSILNYLRWSNISLQIDLNPFVWKIYYDYLHNPDGMNPKLHMGYFRLLMFKLVIHIDDGSW
jgi:hypothetical protein